MLHSGFSILGRGVGTSDISAPVQPPPASRGGRRRRTSAISADAAIRNRLTALSTGVAPSRIRPYIMTVSGGSEPTSISVVLKFSKKVTKRNVKFFGDLWITSSDLPTM